MYLFIFIRLTQKKIEGIEICKQKETKQWNVNVIKLSRLIVAAKCDAK